MSTDGAWNPAGFIFNGEIRCNMSSLYINTHIKKKHNNNNRIQNSRLTYYNYINIYA